MSNPVINLGKMAGDNVDSFVKSVQNTVDMPNGSLVVITGLVSGQDAVYTVGQASDVTAQEVLLVASPEIVEINGYRIDVTDPTQFTNSANKPARAFHVKVGDTFTATDDWVTTGTPSVGGTGAYVVPQNASYTPKAVADLTTAGNVSVVSFQVLQKTTISVGAIRKNATKYLVVKSR